MRSGNNSIAHVIQPQLRQLSPMPKNMGQGNQSKPQFNVRQEADRRLKFLMWLAEHREISTWQVADWLFVAACSLRARTARHDLLLALIGFCEKVGITCDERVQSAVCCRACKAIDRRHGGRWLSGRKAGGYLHITYEERRQYYEETGTFPNIDPADESSIAKHGRKVAERRECRRDHMRTKRRADGVVPRGIYRQQVKRKGLPPWEAVGLTKWTYYRRLKAGTLVAPVRPSEKPARASHIKPMEILSQESRFISKGSYLPSESLASLSHRVTHRVAGHGLKSLGNPGNFGHTPSCTGREGR